jgi:DNA-binding NarL/FixJ family response regulator
MAIRVILEDDHTIVRDALAGLLAAPGDIDVVALAADGREAVEPAIASRPDVAVLDVSMPVLNGIEAAAQLRKLVPTCRVVDLSALR